MSDDVTTWQPRIYEEANYLLTHSPARLTDAHLTQLRIWDAALAQHATEARLKALHPDLPVPRPAPPRKGSITTHSRKSSRTLSRPRWPRSTHGSRRSSADRSSSSSGRFVTARTTWPAEAALETGCRKGEFLSLQWSQVRLDGRPELSLPAQKTKTGKPRTVPISARLLSILAMRRTAPDGELHPATAYVFGTAIGQRVTTVKTAWRLACKRARIDGLHFHDLRREAGSRWLEGGVPLHTCGRGSAIPTSRRRARTCRPRSRPSTT